MYVIIIEFCMNTHTIYSIGFFLTECDGYHFLDSNFLARIQLSSSFDAQNSFLPKKIEAIYKINQFLTEASVQRNRIEIEKHTCGASLHMITLNQALFGSISLTGE